jgi:hypothetical protein
MEKHSVYSAGSLNTVKKALLQIGLHIQNDLYQNLCHSLCRNSQSYPKIFMGRFTTLIVKKPKQGLAESLKW